MTDLSITLSTDLLAEWDQALDTAGLYDPQRRRDAESHLFGAMVAIIATGDDSTARAPLVDQLREAMDAAIRDAQWWSRA